MDLYSGCANCGLLTKLSFVTHVIVVCDWILLIQVKLCTIGSSSVKMVADRHRHAAYHNKHRRRAS